jgi:Fe2+ or Zn2+ uptake regulation protein
LEARRRFRCIAKSDEKCRITNCDLLVRNPAAPKIANSLHTKGKGGPQATPLDDFRDYLVSRGKRLTREREILVDVIFALRPPFTAESVVEAVSRTRNKTRVSRATTYRTLQMLADAGQITIESDSDERIQYSHTYKPLRIDAPISELCQSTHSKMIAGKCPWCGCAILNGKPVDREP